MKRIFYFLLTVLLSIYSIHAQVTVPGTPVTPQVSTKDQTNWYLLMSTTNEGTGQNDRYCRFLQWNGTRLITNQYVDGLSEDQITDNYRWCLEDAGNGNVYIRNAANNLRITVPSSITGNAGGRTNLTMTSEGSIFRWGLSKNEANAPSTCAENQYIFSYTGYTAGNNAYINSMNNAANESDNPFGITIWSGGIDGASGWFFYPAAKPERTVTVVSNNEDMGTVSIQGHGSATITTSENVTVEATAKSGYEFINWTKDGGTEVSSDNPYTYSGKEGINLTANFREKTYPLMKRYYTNGIDQQNRYLKKVSYIVNDVETTIFEANTKEQLPYTWVSSKDETTSGAVLDKTEAKITLPNGTTQFSMSFNAWKENIDGYTPQLNWTKQVYYIDLNQDFEFSGTNEETPALGRKPNAYADGNNFGDLNGGNYDNGWATDILLPADLTAGTYRMRVVYFEPSNDTEWNDTSVKTYASLDGKLKNGIAYDFDIVIEAPAPAERMVTVESADETMGTVAITYPTTGVTGNSVTTADDVTVTATAKSGYTFVNWTNKDGGAVVSSENPYTYTEAEDITLVANFQAVITGWTVNWTNPEHATIEIELTDGTKISNGGTVPYDSEVYIIPTPAPGYRISKVTANGVNVSPKIEEGKLVYKTTIRANTEISVTTSEVIYRIDWDEATFTNGSFQIFNTNDLSTAIVKNSVINIGDKFKVVPVPNDNYMVSRVYYKYFPNPTDDDIVDITESADGYTFTATPNTNPSKNIIYVYADFIEKPAVINRYAQTTKKSNISTDSYVERLEVNDKILGEWSSFTDDSRSNQITLAAWVNFESSSYYADGMAIMGHYQGHYVGNGTTPSFTVSASSNGKMGIFSRTRNDSGGYPGTSSSTINEIDIPQGWFHLALTAKLDGSNIVYKLYVNGEETSASKTVPGNENSNLPYLPDNTDGLGCVLSFGGDMNCKFDDIMIWTEAISPEEVKEAMKGYTDAELASMTTLVGYYTCDDMLENQGTSKNLGSNKTYDLKLQNLKIKALNPPTTGQKEAISEANLATYIQDSERDVPRGGEKLFEGDTNATWLTNGDEDFGYIVKSDNTKRLAYDGFRKVALADNVLAVYHNGDAELPTYVKEEDLESMTGAKTEMTSSYVVAGLDYTVQMPAVAKQWMPISMPAEVDLVTVEGGNGVRPGKNFWYAEPVVTGKNVTWTDITDEGNTDGTSYLNNLNPGIISVPESRVDQRFTFFTALGTPVVMRAYNQAYAAAQMPQAGVLKFVANPYATTVRAAQLTGEAANMTIYRMNTASGNFDPVEGTVTLKEFEPVFVFNNGGNPSMAPRYIGTKDVSGVLEAEAVYNVNVRGTKGAIEVEAFVPADIEIFTVNGVKVAAEKVEGTRAFNLLSGIYVVRTVADGNAETIKVVVE